MIVTSKLDLDNLDIYTNQPKYAYSQISVYKSAAGHLHTLS